MYFLRLDTEYLRQQTDDTKRRDQNCSEDVETDYLEYTLY